MVYEFTPSLRVMRRCLLRDQGSPLSTLSTSCSWQNWKRYKFVVSSLIQTPYLGHQNATSVCFIALKFIIRSVKNLLTMLSFGLHIDCSIPSTAITTSGSSSYHLWFVLHSFTISSIFSIPSMWITLCRRDPKGLNSLKLQPHHKDRPYKPLNLTLVSNLITQARMPTQPETQK